jgi:polar amino acid transport system permease protein
MHPDARTAPPRWIDLFVFAGVVCFLGFAVWRLTFVLDYRWDWSTIPRYILRWDAKTLRWVPNILLLGLFTTIRLTIWGGLIALVAGTAIGCARASNPLFFRLSGRCYVECIRNIPELVFIFIFYFFVASQIMPYLGIDAALARATPTQLAVIGVLFGEPRLFTSFLPAVIAIGLFESASVAEIVRAGIQSVPRGQSESANALGLSSWHTMRLVVFPQAVRRVLPPLAGQLIALVKDSSLAAIISVPELSFAGSEVAGATRNMFEAWFTVGATYFVICFSLSTIFSRLEQGGRARGPRLV